MIKRPPLNISRSAGVRYFFKYLSCLKLGHLDLANENTNFLSKSSRFDLPVKKALIFLTAARPLKAKFFSRFKNLESLSLNKFTFLLYMN